MTDLSNIHGKPRLTHSHHSLEGHHKPSHETVGASLVHQTVGKAERNREAEERHHREEETSRRLHEVKVTDLERDKQVVVNTHESRNERLRAAHELVANNVREINFADEFGKHRCVHLDRSAVDGRLRISEGNHIILEENNGRSYTDHLRAPAYAQGVHYAAHNFDNVGSYHAPTGGRRIYSPAVDPHYYSVVQNPDGSKTVEFNGCQVDTDGASFHPEDSCWQSHTSLRLSNGESLNTDLDNFVVLSPSLAKACGVKMGDCGYLVDKGTGRAVPVVFGDSGPEGKRSAEASVHAIKQLGRNERVDGNHGLEGRFEVVVVPHSGNGKGDLARNPAEIKQVLDARTTHHTDVS